MNTVTQRVQTTLARVFGVEAEEITEETSMDTLALWTSLQHLNLVIALEEEFHISFTEEETVQIISVPLILAVLSEHGVGR